ncbi:facilitated trehalose transporter Tret1 [Caerostris extrusa]|uniref:Facilitated trehalose transporter Tret1 n=1 Tax=Caerostris extrusa TaxID=172846 RepID=A0AAV4YFR4_CAEEX|nr:facilitated trehalose transporter Tret1 [Caerostris extrusa]
MYMPLRPVRRMEDVHRDVEKLRSSSAASSTSSVTEYVNEVFTASELELSKGVIVQVAANTQWVENPLSDEESGMKKRKNSMYLAALIVLTFAINMGITATYSATATVDMQKNKASIDPTDDEVTWIGSLMAIGALVGGTAGGYFTNVLGRKGALILDTVPFVLGWMSVAYANSTGLIYLGRVLTGFCCGIVSVATPMYLVEISTPDVRGLLGASFQLFVVVGVLLISFLGSQLTWRYSAVSGGVMSLLAAALMIPMPESPKWLMAQKRRGEAKNAIVFLQGISYDAEDECLKMEEEIQAQPKGSVTFSELKAPTVLKPFMLSILLMFFQQFSGVNAVLFYTANIFESAHSSLDSITATIYVNIVQVIATLISSLLMDRAGRKALLIFSGSCMALSLIVFGGFDLALSKDASITDKYGWLPMVCLMSYIAAFSLGFGPTPWLMVAEMTPVRFRGIVSGIATALNWTFVFIVTKSFKMEQDTMHGYGVYWMYASLCVSNGRHPLIRSSHSELVAGSAVEDYYANDTSHVKSVLGGIIQWQHFFTHHTKRKPLCVQPKSSENSPFGLVSVWHVLGGFNSRFSRDARFSSDAGVPAKKRRRHARARLARKRAHVRRFEPPGFLGVRGKKSSKSKDPVPGFLGVRGKKCRTIRSMSNLL